MWFLTLPLLLLPILSLTSPIQATYTNPILPGWHSDPSCTRANDTIFCTTSTFLAYPGFPIYASKDLLHWKLASNAFNRESQIPVLHDIPSSTTTGGNFAPTLRYRNGVFYLITTFFVQIDDQVELKGLVFRSTDPWNDDAWSRPVEFPVIGIDPDIFWDDHDDTPDDTPNGDELVYVTSTDSHQIQHYTLNLTTGQTGPPTPLWNGTGGHNPEGSLLYKKDNYYYLLLAEGGTELGHSSTIARSRSRTGPWEASPHNPLLTNRNTTQFFQTVGHADLFADAQGKWWTVALGTRSGPEWTVYPMGRETVLTPVQSGEDGWPVARAVRGVMDEDLPNTDREGKGGYVDDPDEVDFEPGSAIPKHFVHWRYPKKDAFAISAADSGHANTLRLTPSVYNLTGNVSASSGEDGITFIARRQTDTLFTYSVDLQFNPKTVHEEAGVTVFLTQAQHIDLGIISLPSPSQGNPELSIRFRAQGRGNLKGPLPTPKTTPVPESWTNSTVRLQIQTVNATHYAFSASPASSSGQGQDQSIVLGYAEAAIVSGGTGPYTGALVGTYATTNGVSADNETQAAAYFSRWRYHGQGQQIDYGVFVPSIPTS